MITPMTAQNQSAPTRVVKWCQIWQNIVKIHCFPENLPTFWQYFYVKIFPYVKNQLPVLTK